MGQQPPTSPSQTPPTTQQLQECVANIFHPADDKPTLDVLHISIHRLLESIRRNLPAEIVHGKMQINPIMLKIFYSPNFSSTLLKLIHLLTQQLHELHNRNFLLVKRDELIFLVNLASFILFFTDQKIAQTIHALTFRKDLATDTLTCIDLLENKDMKFNPHRNFLDLLTPAQAQQMHDILQNNLIKLISSRMQIMTRSSLTFEVISQMESCLFVLFLKLIKTPFHSKNFASKIRKPPALKYHLRIGQHFLAQGCDQARASVYEAGVLLLLVLVDRNGKNLAQIDSQLSPVPSHLYKNLPIWIKNTFYNFLAVTCLFSLALVKQGSQFYTRLNLNRIPTLRLVSCLIVQKKVTSVQMTELLEKICLVTRIGSIERGFMGVIVEKYNKLVREKGKENKRMEEVKKTTGGFANKFLQRIRTAKPQKPSPLLSVYSTESTPSQILEKYVQSASQPYRIKFQSRKYTIPPGIVVEQFQKGEEFQQKQLQSLCQKFTYESVLLRKVTYKFIESVEWAYTLPRIIKAHQIVGEEVEEEDGGLRNSRKVVGAMPVIVQRYVGVIESVGEKTIKRNKEKEIPKQSYLQTQAAQGINMPTSNEQRIQQFKLELKATQLVRQPSTSNHQAEKPSAPHNISLVFEQQQGQIEQIDERFQTSELELNKRKQDPMGQSSIAENSE